MHGYRFNPCPPLPFDAHRAARLAHNKLENGTGQPSANLMKNPWRTLPKPQWLRGAALTAVLFLLCGCATHYDVTMGNGTTIRAKTKPKLNDQGYFVFKDLAGQEVAVNRMRVREIEAVRRGAPSSHHFR